MTAWALTNNNHIVICCGQCLPSASSDDFLHMDGVLHLPAPDGTRPGGRLVDGVFSPKPEMPGRFHVFDEEQFAWILPSDHIETAKESAKERINAAWKHAEQQPFLAYGKTFDADDKAVQRILGAAQGALVAKLLGVAMSPIEWTCADNSKLLMDVDMLATVPIVVAQAADTLHRRCRTLKAQIDAATTIDQIDAVVW